MKKLLGILLLGLVLSGCTTTDEKVEQTTDTNTTTEVTATTETQNVLDKIIEKGTIVVVTSPGYAPMEFLDSDNNVIGSDAALAEYIAEQLGVKLEWLTVDFSGTLTALDTNKADVAISGYGWKEDRAENYELSTPYNDVANSESGCNTIVVPTEDVDKYQSFADFKGLKIGGQANSIQESLAKTQTEAEVVPFNDVSDGFLLLMSNKIDGVALSCSVAKGQVNANEGVSLTGLEFVNSDITGNVVIVKKGETVLIDKINEILDDVNSNGLYEQWDSEAKEIAKGMGIDFE